MIKNVMTMIVRDNVEGMKNISCMKNKVGMHEKCYTLFAGKHYSHTKFLTLCWIVSVEVRGSERGELVLV